MEPQYLADPLFPLCKDICPTWKQGSTSFLDLQCHKSCSYALSQWACSPEKQMQLLDLLSQAATANDACKFQSFEVTPSA